MHGLDAPADQMQLLCVPDPKPCARNIHLRTGNSFQPKHFTKERNTLFHIRDVQGNVIDLPNRHAVFNCDAEYPSITSKDLIIGPIRMAATRSNNTYKAWWTSCGRQSVSYNGTFA